MIYDARLCELGEGPFWHPEREQLFWFDILAGRLLSRDAGGEREWQFPHMVSAAGWIARDTLLIAGETGLFQLDLISGAQTPIAAIEADDPRTRSNDGRADPMGGFWIGTMGKRGGDDPGLGSIWRYHRGTLRRLFPGLTIPNSIAFAADGRMAQFSDTVTGKVFRVALDADGWPTGQPQVFLDLTSQGLWPDGSVIDADGVTWLAQWGAGRVAAYAPDGQFLRAVPVGAPHSSCPAFGGAGLTTLFCTTAREGLDAAALAEHPDSGRVFAVADVARGRAEPRVIL